MGHAQRKIGGPGELANRAHLVEDVVQGRLVFRSRPVEAHVQFSTYCNQSCVMCWNGNHPPTRDLDDAVLEQLEREVAPTLSILIPHDGSEPTARRWREICQFARDHHLELDLTTNVQALSERRLRDALDVIGQLHLSVDSHLPDVLTRMRPGVRARAVLRNLPALVAVAREAGIDCDVNVVLTTLNAPTLPETIEWFASIDVEAVSLLRLVDSNGTSRHLDPLSVWSEQEIGQLVRRIDRAARVGRVNLWNQIDGTERFNGSARAELADGSSSRPSPHRRAHSTNRDLELVRPGYCRFVHSGIRVAVDGDIAPCGYAGQGELPLGNLRNSPFERIWNGASAQDLRRAMLTRDLPKLCRGCVHAQIPEPTSDLPMMQRVPPFRSGALSFGAWVDGPDHGYRASRTPSFTLSVDAEGTISADAGTVRLHLARGGGHEVHELPLALRRRRGQVALVMDDSTWESLEPNVGYWWVLSVERHGDRSRATEAARCMIRHEDRARIPGSALDYGAAESRGTLPLVPDPVAVSLR